MAITGSQYTIDFTTEAAEDPWVDANWTNVNNSWEIAGGGLRPNGFVQATSKLNNVADAAIIKAKMTFATNGSAFSDPVGPAIIDDSTGACYIFWVNGVGASSGQIQERTTGSGNGTVLGAGFAISSAGTSDVFELWYEVATGILSAVFNDTVLTTRTDTTLQASSLRAGLFASPANNNGRRVGQFGADYTDAAAVTIDDTDADTRVTEPRTVRITVDSTAPTTANTNIYIDADTNDAIVPDSCTLVSGTTYDIVFTVPDEYAGLPYDNIGYPIIVSTVDGDATSGDVPYLPVTGNDFVVLTSAPGDFGTSLGTLAVPDIIEWETNGGDITVNSDGTITSTNPNTTFEARAWDATDSTYGAWALQTLGSGGSGSTGMTSSGLSESGLTDRGLTTSGLSS